MAVEHIRRWKIGDVEVVRLVELWNFEDDLWVLLDGGTAEHMKRHAWLQPHYATPDGRMILNFQAFAVRTPDRAIMVDTCLGNGRKREYDVFTNLQTTFLEDLAHAGFDREKIDTVLCTHLHIDHCGWNTMRVGDQWVPTFPNARYLFGQKELDYWEERAAAGAEHMEHVEDSIDPIVAAGLVDVVPPDFQICPEITLEPTPGHTPGHVSVVINSKGKRAVISGDVLHHPIQLCEPDMVNNFDIDPVKGAQTRKDYLTRYQDTDVLFIGTHFADPTAGKLIGDGDRWRFEGGE